jgi:hypothetical protein
MHIFAHAFVSPPPPPPSFANTHNLITVRAHHAFAIRSCSVQIIQDTLLTEHDDADTEVSVGAAPVESKECKEGGSARPPAGPAPNTISNPLHDLKMVELAPLTSKESTSVSNPLQRAKSQAFEL